MACKIPETLFLLVSRPTHYRDLASDFKPQSNPSPRWLKMPKKRGVIPAPALSRSSLPFLFHGIKRPTWCSHGSLIALTVIIDFDQCQPVAVHEAR